VPKYQAAALRDPLKSLLPAERRVLASATPQGTTISTGSSAPTGAVALPPLVVQGVVWGTLAPKAIINNEVYGVGDVVRGVTIVSITHEGVLVEVHGAMVRLTTATNELLEPPYVP
jgi:hypothetical protein